MTTPDTTTPEVTTEENAAAAAATVVEAGPAAPETTAEAQAETVAPAEDATAATQAVPTAVETAPLTEQAAPATAVAAPAAAETAVAAPAAEEEDPQTTVFSLLTFFLAALPVIGVVLNAIAVARAGKEGFDLWLARWGLALAIIETIGALALVGLGYYLGVVTAG